MPVPNAADHKHLRTNEWLIRRTVNSTVISVMAQRIPSLSTWGITCKVNGELVDTRQSDDPFKAAMDLVAEHTQ